jgi:hypothetical protein
MNRSATEEYQKPMDHLGPDEIYDRSAELRTAAANALQFL